MSWQQPSKNSIMKKTILVLGIAFSLFSCQKDDVFEKPTSDTNNTIVTPTRISGVEVQNEMLSFSSLEHFEKTVEELEKAMINQNNSFRNRFKDLSDDEFTNKAQQVGFNFYEKLDALEKQYNYTSLRKVMVTQAGLYKNHPVSSSAWQTLLNKHGEVKIGDEVHIYKPNGDYYYMFKPELEIIRSIRLNAFEFNEETHGKFMAFKRGGFEECIFSGQDTRTFSGGFGVNFTTKLSVWGTYGPYYTIGSGTTPAYFDIVKRHTGVNLTTKKKMFGGNWVSFNASMKMNTFETSWFDNVCTTQVSNNESQASLQTPFSYTITKNSRRGRYKKDILAPYTLVEFTYLFNNYGFSARY